MKKIFVIIAAFLVLCIIATSCSKNEESESTEPYSEIITDENESDVTSAFNENDYTAPIKDPDFTVYYTLDDFIAKNQIPNYDRTEKDSLNENYYSKDVLTSKKTFDEKGNLVSQTIYNDDGASVKSEISIDYQDDTSCALKLYSGESVKEEFQFTYDKNKKIRSAYRMTYDSDGAFSEAEAYEFDENGNVTAYVDPEGVSEALNNVLSSAFGNAIEEMFGGLLG